MSAKNAREQHQAMLQLLERGLTVPAFKRIEIAGELMAAQITFNGMLLDEIDQLKREKEKNG